MLFDVALQLVATILFQTFAAGNSLFGDGTSVVEMNALLESRFATTNSTTLAEWERSLPSESEKNEIRKLLNFIYSQRTFDSLTGAVVNNYASLKGIMDVTILQNHFCVIHEVIPRKEHQRFPRMWGYTAIASKDWAQRPIHHSAAHFDSEGPVCAQAAALFENTKSRSLVVAGASRYAVKGGHPSDCQNSFQVADAAHNSRTMFHFVNTMIKDLAEQESGAKEKNSHFFVQWHGMAQSSCVASDVFISAGIRNSSIYDTDIPAMQLRRSFNCLASVLGMKASTPREDHDCKLTAGTNVFGRYVNDVSPNNVCTTPAEEKHVVGKFVHVEQKEASRENISLWTSVIEDAFIVGGSSSQLSAVVVISLSVVIVFS